MTGTRSRPVRLAAELAGVPEAVAADTLATKRVLIGLERTDPDSIATFLLAVNQTLRFCSNVGLVLPEDLASAVRDECDQLATAITGSAANIRGEPMAAAGRYDAILFVGATVRQMTGWITVTSDGWVAQTASWIDDDDEILPRSTTSANPIGAHLAASVGVGRVFRRLIGLEPGRAFELSAHRCATGPLGTFGPGPAIPGRLPELDGLLVGCGSVMHGWAYTARRLPIFGRARAIDPQVLANENVGTYVLAGLGDIGSDKVEILKSALESNIHITADRDFAELFSRRLEGELEVPALVVAGLDETAPRHVVQRWWPSMLIDMGTDGFTSQVIMKSTGDDGMCLLDALPDWAEVTGLQLAAAGAGLTRALSAAQLLEPIDDEDIAAAPAQLRDKLLEAKDAGVRRCSWIRVADVQPSADPTFAAAAPFVAGLTGTLAAGRTVAYLMGDPAATSVRLQASFVSERAVVLESRSSAGCECLAHLMPRAVATVTTRTS